MASTITFRLTEEQDGFIDGMIESGDFSNQSEVIRAGIRLLQEQRVESKLVQLRQLVREGENSPIIDDWSAESFIGRMKKSTMPDAPVFYVHEKADSDLEKIFDYSVTQFGFARAAHYVYDIEQALNNLAANPSLGRRFDPDVSRYFQHPIESHNVFYITVESGVEILRILHQSMLPTRHI